MASAPGAEENTLDEPIATTLKRDLVAILVKLRHVIIPSSGARGADALRDWDLWGPLIFCFIVAIIVNSWAAAGEGQLMFAMVFALVWGGSLIVTINAKFVGGKLSFFQSLTVLGYCLFPLCIAASILAISASAGFSHIAFRSLIVLACLVWTVFSVYGFIASRVPRKRRFLVVYPTILFYLVISWIIMVTVVNDGSVVLPPVGNFTTVARGTTVPPFP